jgi:hypothetical protein
LRDEYDFSKGERGKFFRRDAVLIPPARPRTEDTAIPTSEMQELAEPKRKGE